MQNIKIEYIQEINTQTVGDEKWLVTKEFCAHLNVEGQPLVIKINPGFITDFCTVPRLPFVYLILGNLAKAAGLIHDALYSNYEGIHVFYADDETPHFYDRHWADKIFLQALMYLGMSFWQAQLMYRAVRILGIFYYKKDKHADHQISDKP